jgi:hypothetical protein
MEENNLISFFSALTLANCATHSGCSFCINFFRHLQKLNRKAILKCSHNFQCETQNLSQSEHPLTSLKGQGGFASFEKCLQSSNPSNRGGNQSSALQCWEEIAQSCGRLNLITRAGASGRRCHNQFLTKGKNALLPFVEIDCSSIFPLD